MPLVTYSTSFFSFHFSSSFFFFLFFHSSLFQCLVPCYLFFLIESSKMKEKKILILFTDFILHTFKNLSFFHPTKGHTFSFWPCYLRYALLIIVKFPVELSLLTPLLHLSLETTDRFIYLSNFFTILLSLSFLSRILGSL